MKTVKELLERLEVDHWLGGQDVDRAEGVQVTLEEGKPLTLDVRLPREEGGFRVVRIVRHEGEPGATSVGHDVKEVEDWKRDVEEAARRGYSGT